jgi:hypothetical protein
MVQKTVYIPISKAKNTKIIIARNTERIPP